MVERSIGKRIKEYRKKKGLTQEQLAEKVGLSTNYVSAIERGVNALNLDKLVEVMNCLDCSADEIFVDVLKNSCEIKVSLLTEQISSLPEEEQERIFAIIQTLIDTAKR